MNRALPALASRLHLHVRWPWRAGHALRIPRIVRARLSTNGREIAAASLVLMGIALVAAAAGLL